MWWNGRIIGFNIEVNKSEKLYLYQLDNKIENKQYSAPQLQFSRWNWPQNWEELVGLNKPEHWGH